MNAWPWLTEPQLPGVVDFLSAGVRDALDGGEGRLGEPDAAILARHERELAGIDGRLSVYRDRPDLLALDDPLAETLARAREILEAVHGTTIRFPGEDRPLQVGGRFGKVAGKLLVLEADDLTLDPAAPVVVDPTVEEVAEGGEAVVARIKRINPPVLRRDG